MKHTEFEFLLKENLIFDALPGAAAIINQEGDVVFSNERWSERKDNYHWFGTTPDTDNYFEHCGKAVRNGNDYALKLIFGLREVLDGNKERFELTAPCFENMGKRWFKATISRYDKNEGGAMLLFEDVSKNMRIVQSLRESEEIYGQHFQHSLAGIILGTSGGGVIDVNPAGSKMLGYTRDELIEGGLSIVVDEKNPVNKKAAIERAKKSSFEGEQIYTHKNGTHMVVEVSSALYKNEHGELRVINTFRDKTKEKEILESLNHERRFTEAVLNSTPNIFFVISEEFKLIRWNDVFIDELGYDEEYVSGSNALDYFSESEKDRVREIAAEAFETGTGHIITEVLSRKKGLRHYHLQAKSFSSNEKCFLVGTGTDISDMIEIEKEKDKNYELISQLFESSPLGMVMISSENKIMKANNSFTSLFGYSKLEIIGEKTSDLIMAECDRDEYRQFMGNVFSGNISKKEVIRRNRDGDKLTIIINGVPIWQDDKVVAAYMIYVDLTEQKKLETRIQKSLNEKEILLKEVHHRVKNNLAVIAGLLDLQIMEEEECLIEDKLNEVRSRIFSIAKIHETLYEKEDVVQIRFDEYLDTMMNALPQKELLSKEIKVQMDAAPVFLNLNQAVPCGLAVNELMNIIFANSDSLSELKVILSEKDDQVELSIESDQLNLCAIDPKTGSDEFQKKLIQIFMAQINATLSITEVGGRQVRLCFKKMNIRGSSSSVMSSAELLSN